MCAKLHTVAASNNRDHPKRSLSSSPLASIINCSPGSHALLEITPSGSLYYCLFAPRIYIFVLRAHPIRGESHNQRNTTREVATTSPLLFYNEPHRSNVLCVKAKLSTTFTSWSQHHFLAIRNPVQHVRKASHRGRKQQ